MAAGEQMRYVFRPAGYWNHGNADLDRQEQTDLMQAVAGVYTTPEAAEAPLQAIGFPKERRPAWTTANVWWRQVFDELKGGAAATTRPPFLRLLATVVQTYQRHPVFRPLAIRYGILVPDTAEAPRSAKETCRAIIGTGSPDRRNHALATLRRLGLKPAEVWSTLNATSYRVNSADTKRVWVLLGGTDLESIVVAPGEPDYLLSQLTIEAPDGRWFKATDSPAQQLVRELAVSVLAQYDWRFREPVMDRVGPDSQGQRLNPDDTLHVAGIEDGDNLRVGFEGEVGLGIAPQDRNTHQPSWIPAAVIPRDQPVPQFPWMSPTEGPPSAGMRTAYARLDTPDWVAPREIFELHVGLSPAPGHLASVPRRCRYLRPSSR